jgi:hypothetical protein
LKKTKFSSNSGKRPPFSGEEGGAFAIFANVSKSVSTGGRRRERTPGKDAGKGRG